MYIMVTVLYKLSHSAHMTLTEGGNGMSPTSAGKDLFLAVFHQDLLITPFFCMF